LETLNFQSELLKDETPKRESLRAGLSDLSQGVTQGTHRLLDGKEI
jgi:hypothetical protein